MDGIFGPCHAGPASFMLSYTWGYQAPVAKELWGWTCSSRTPKANTSSDLISLLRQETSENQSHGLFCYFLFLMQRKRFLRFSTAPDRPVGDVNGHAMAIEEPHLRHL